MGVSLGWRPRHCDHRCQAFTRRPKVGAVICPTPSLPWEGRGLGSWRALRLWAQGLQPPQPSSATWSFQPSSLYPRTPQQGVPLTTLHPQWHNCPVAKDLKLTPGPKPMSHTAAEAKKLEHGTWMLHALLPRLQCVWLGNRHGSSFPATAATPRTLPTSSRRLSSPQAPVPAPGALKHSSTYQKRNKQTKKKGASSTPLRAQIRNHGVHIRKTTLGC